MLKWIGFLLHIASSHSLLDPWDGMEVLVGSMKPYGTAARIGLLRLPSTITTTTNVHHNPTHHV